MYKRQDRFRALVERLYAAVPGLALSTDVIAGFPGETDAEFQETLELARACRFAKMHAFPYSRRAGTPAAERPDQVPPDIKAARAAALRALGDELRAAERARRAGTVEMCIRDRASIVRAIRAAVAHPVTVKFRRGWAMGAETAPDFARRMEDAGACAVAVHGRFAEQLYRGSADWDVVARVKEAVDCLLYTSRCV